MKKDTPKVSVKEIVPELYAQRCPTCNGFGSLKYGAKICNGCNGKTYILVPVRRKNEK
jgi:DnaJ-class molecular chaperone